MSITTSYHRLSVEEFENLRADPKLADAHFGYDLDEEDDAAWDAWIDQRDTLGRYLDIGKTWHGLNFLLTGNAEMDNTKIVVFSALLR